jgi:HK97 family phage major capsid protein
MYDHTSTSELERQFVSVGRELERRDSVRNPGETRGGGASAARAPGEIQGQANELLRPDQSVSEWRSRAMENGVDGLGRRQGTDRDLNRYWAERIGIAPRSIETRALGEDTASGAGAAQAIVPQEWSTSFIDLLRSKLVLSAAGVSTMPMTTEKVNVPQWMADVAPAWLAEGGATSLDANPQFSTIQFNANGAYADVTLVSRQVLEDTNQSGGLAQLVQDVIAAKYARLIESVAFYGTASNAGNPGLVNESNVVINWNGTNGGAPTDSTPFSVAAESVRNANAEPAAFITNPSLRGTFARLNASTYAHFWEMPPDVAAIPVLDTTAIVSNETHGTGTNLSSFYAGPFHRMVMGIRTDLDVQVLRERYADQLQVGFVSYMRFSIRTTHPEAFVKQGGYITT